MTLIHAMSLMLLVTLKGQFMIPIRFLLFTLVISVLLYNPAMAHKVTVFAWVEGDTVHTECKFSGGRKVKSGKIEVYDHNNQKVVHGTTDDKGYFAFPVPQAAKQLKVVLIAGTGHSNSWQITGEELGRKAAAPEEHTAHPDGESIHQTQMDPKTLERIVERAVEKKLAPIRAQLAEQAWGLRDIVSGLGYILGLMGLASYIHYRKMLKDHKK